MAQVARALFDFGKRELDRLLESTIDSHDGLNHTHTHTHRCRFVDAKNETQISFKKNEIIIVTHEDATGMWMKGRG
jgi:hypothetical protein